MSQTDLDMEELESLLGHTKAAYQQRDYTGDLVLPQQAEQQRRPWRRIAMVAGFVGLALIGTSLFETMQPTGSSPRFAMPKPVASPLTMRPLPQARAQVRLSQFKSSRPSTIRPSRPVSGSRG